MKAIVISKNKILYKEVSDPKIIKNNDVIVKVKAVGLCGSDVQNIEKIGYKEKKILGHEIIGEVIVTNKNRSPIKIGDMVVISPIIGCSKCSICKKGYIQHCLNKTALGKNVNGGFAEKILVTNNKNLYKIPSDKFEYKFVLADPLAVCIHALQFIPNLYNKNVGIIGNGTIGELFRRVAKYKGAKEAILFDKNTKNYSKYKDHFDITVECVGRNNCSTVNTSIDITKIRGTILVLGVFKENYILPLNARKLFSKEICMIGSNSYTKTNRKDDFKKAIDLILKEKIKIKGIITNVFKLKDFKIGLKLFKNKGKTQTKKIVFLP